MSDDTASDLPDIMEDTYWRKGIWSARVVKNDSDDGWAVEVFKAGLDEPVLVSPWVMGRDKKNPKPFDTPAFMTFVKTATEYLARSARQREGALKKSLAIAWEGIWYDVTLEQVADEYDPRATLSAKDPSGATVASYSVPPGFKFTRDFANDWVRGGFSEP